MAQRAQNAASRPGARATIPAPPASAPLPAGAPESASHWGINPDRCPLTAAMTIIGGKWKAHIWWRIRQGLARPADLRRAMPTITAKTLTQQLRELERAGVVRRAVYPEVPPRVEYTLTEYGETLAPVFFTISAWGAEHLKRKSPPAP